MKEKKKKQNLTYFNGYKYKYSTRPGAHQWIHLMGS